MTDKNAPKGGIGAAPEIAATTDVDEIGVGMLGYAFMGKAHTNAYRTLAYMTWPPPLVPRLVSVAGRNATPCRRPRPASE